MGDYQEDVKGTKFSSKPDVWDEILRILRRFLDYCLCCVTCGCVPVPEDRLHGDMCEAELLDEERTAVQNLLLYLDSSDAKEPYINEERLHALCILTYSDNVELQRSAALCYAEISERMKLPVSGLVLEPLVVLLKSRDAQVQKTASLAISNFALSGPVENNAAILSSGATKPLIQLLSSDNLEVQCNTCGCITTLATNDKSKQEIVAAGGVAPLLLLTKSRDLRVQRNATGALLNLTHLQSNRNDLVSAGAVPVLVDALLSSDADVQYYCAAALSNLAVNERHRAMMVAIGYNDVTKRLIQLLHSKKEKVKCQACLALRNLASDTDNQVLIVKLDCLPALHHVIKHSRPDTVSAAMACLRNLSIHRNNEVSIMQTFLAEIPRIVHDMSNPQAQMHAAGTIRNLSAGDQMPAIAQSGCIEALLDMVMCADCSEHVLVEVTAALAVLADDDESRQCILEYKDGAAFSHMITMASANLNADIAYNCAGTIGQLCVGDISSRILEPNLEGLVLYLGKFLASEDPSLVHIALWTLLQLLKDESFRSVFEARRLDRTVQRVSDDSQTSTIKELSQAVLDKLEL